MAEKIKVLALCDYACGTGFATVAGNIMRELDKTGEFELHIQGINFTGDQNYNSERFPGILYPAANIETLGKGGQLDVYGLEKFKKLAFELNPDVIFILQDTFIAQMLYMPQAKHPGGLRGLGEILQLKEHIPKTIFYFPIDAPPSPDWITEAVCYTDYPVPYTGYAAEESIKAYEKLKKILAEKDPPETLPELIMHRPIYHGTNVQEFTYIKDRKKVKEFRYEWFNRGFADGKFVLLNVNRNQPRKDILMCLQVMKCLRDLGDTDTLLYLHMRNDDVGGNIIRQAEQLGLAPGDDFILPNWDALAQNHRVKPNQGIDVETMNYIYNACDAVISTTHGEGWGLSMTEGFATKTPVIAPNNTSFTEMGADNRAILVDSGDTYNHWNWQPNDNDRIRPSVNVEKMAKAVLELKAGRAVPDIDMAYNFAQKYSWENICKEWIELFREAGAAAKAETKQRLLEAERLAKAGAHGKGKSKKDRKRERQNKKKGRR